VAAEIGDAARLDGNVAGVGCGETADTFGVNVEDMPPAGAGEKLRGMVGTPLAGAGPPIGGLVIGGPVTGAVAGGTL
jgi:hypothetical protein